MSRLKLNSYEIINNGCKIVLIIIYTTYSNYTLYCFITI